MLNNQIGKSDIKSIFVAQGISHTGKKEVNIKIHVWTRRESLLNDKQ